MVNQAFRIKIAYRSEKKKEEKEKAMDRSVPDGSDKNVQILTRTHGKVHRGRELASVLIIGLWALDNVVAPACNLLDRE